MSVHFITWKRFFYNIKVVTGYQNSFLLID